MSRSTPSEVGSRPSSTSTRESRRPLAATRQKSSVTNRALQGSTPTLALVSALGVMIAAQACGGKPLPPLESQSPLEPQSSASPGKRRAGLIDDCAQQPGKPAPDALKREYYGVAASARCDREVYSIMGGVVHSLGTSCEYCHVKDNYPAMTHRKQVANWMAQELIPSIRAKTGKDVWCSDCHHTGAKGTPKPLGNPRKQAHAVEWMNLQLVARFETKAGEPLFCKGCHGGNLGTPEFKAKLILTDLMGDGSYSHTEAPHTEAPHTEAPHTEAPHTEAPHTGSAGIAAPSAVTGAAPTPVDAGAPTGDAQVSDMGDRK